MKKLFMILLLAVAAAAYFSHLGTGMSGVCYASDCPDGCGGGGSDDPDGTGSGDDSGPDGTGDGGGSGSDPDGSGGGGDF